MDDQKTYIVILKPEPGADHQKTLRGLRRWLKACLRGYHLRCVSITTSPRADQSPTDAQEVTQ